MKVISLKGPASSGKSQTLNLVYFNMIEAGWQPVPGHFMVLGDPAQQDFLDLLEKDGIRVGFATMGDYVTGAQRGVKRLLEQLEDLGCHIAISAFTADKPRIADAVSSYEIHRFIEKTVQSEADKAAGQNWRIHTVADAQQVLAALSDFMQ